MERQVVVIRGFKVMSTMARKFEQDAGKSDSLKRIVHTVTQRFQLQIVVMIKL